MGNVENIVKDKDILLELKEKEEILWGEVVRVGKHQRSEPICC